MIKSPINQTGRKFRLLPQILPYIPEFNTALDVFAGSGDVAINAGFTHINDNCQPLIEWLEVLNKTPVDTVLDRLDWYVDFWSLNKTDPEPYYNLRDFYNGYGADPYQFYLLHAHAFSNQIRFNQTGGFNLPFGQRTFNDTMRKNLANFSQHWYGREELTFTSVDFTDLIYDHDFVYLDPPYTCGVASYNTGWGFKQDAEMFVLLNQLDRMGIKWALSNVFENNGQINTALKAFAQKYNVVNIVSDYKGSNYQRKNKGQTKEVLVMNYG